MENSFETKSRAYIYERFENVYANFKIKNIDSNTDHKALLITYRNAKLAKEYYNTLIGKNYKFLNMPVDVIYNPKSFGETDTDNNKGYYFSLSLNSNCKVSITFSEEFVFDAFMQLPGFEFKDKLEHFYSKTSLKFQRELICQSFESFIEQIEKRIKFLDEEIPFYLEDLHDRLQSSFKQFY